MKDFLTFRLSGGGGELSIRPQCIVGFHQNKNSYEESILHVNFLIVSQNLPSFSQNYAPYSCFSIKETVAEIREKLEIEI